MSSGSALNVSFVNHGAFFAVFPALLFFAMVVQSSCINVTGTGSRVNGAQEASTDVIHPSDVYFPRHASWMQPGSSSCDVAFGNLRSN